jgi:hypothetical protein
LDETRPQTESTIASSNDNPSPATPATPQIVDKVTQPVAPMEQKEEAVIRISRAEMEKQIRNKSNELKKEYLG